MERYCLTYQIYIVHSKNIANKLIQRESHKFFHLENEYIAYILKKEKNRLWSAFDLIHFDKFFLCAAL